MVGRFAGVAERIAKGDGMRYLAGLLLVLALCVAAFSANACPKVVFEEQQVPTPAVDEWLFASQNLWHFNDAVSPRRLRMLAHYVRDRLQSPHLLAVQEVASHDVLMQLAAVIKHIGGPEYDTWLIPGNDAGNMHVGVLVRKPLRVERVAALFTEVGTRTSVALFQRPPLHVQLAYPALDVVVVHQRSGLGLPERQAAEQRLAQAEHVLQWVRERHGQQREVLLLGDFNTHDQADIFGEPYAVYNQPPLRNALMLVPEADRFTYIYRCQRQAIDHAFVTPGLWHKVNRAAISRGNAGRYDALYASKGEFVVSDHDGIAVYVQQPTD